MSNKSNLQASIDASFPDNSTGLISPQDVRDYLNLQLDGTLTEDTVYFPRTQADWDDIGTDMGGYIQLPDNARYEIWGLDGDPSTFSKQLRPGLENIFSANAVNQGVLKYTGIGVGIYIGGQTFTFRRINYDGDGTNIAFEIANGGVFRSVFMDTVLVDNFVSVGTAEVGQGFLLLNVNNFTNCDSAWNFTGASNGLLISDGGGVGGITNTVFDLNGAIFSNIEVKGNRSFLTSPTAIFLDGDAGGANISTGIGSVTGNDINVSGGAAMLGANLDVGDDNWFYQNNVGLTNTAWIGSYQFSNVTATTVTLTQNVPALIDVVTVEQTDVVQRLLMTANSRITNESETSVIISITYVLTEERNGGGGAQEVDFCIVINGNTGSPEFCKTIEMGSTRADSVINAIITLDPSEYFEPWVENTTNSSDIDVYGLTCSAHRIDT
jgi:hypothetical protein